MRKYLTGLVLGLLLAAPSLYALRVERPAEFNPEWDSNSAAQLNNQMLGMWNLTNGRYQSDVVTVDPDGSRRGIAGECVYYDAGTDRWCCNATGTQRSPTTVWKCVDLT